MNIHVATFGAYELSDDSARVDFPRVHSWLSETYWCSGIPFKRLRRGFDNSSVVAGAYLPEHGQCGIARVVTDFTRFAYLMDVFVDPAHRGEGVGKAIVSFLLDHPRMGDIDTWSLATRDAHSLYESFGFTLEPHPERWMVKRR
jgi:GNAT superfamily N-acetyltransferase